ncbi:MAG: C4-type zinc ribbon domain-containing protein [Actinomycetota bacterium]|nr:C4-type zinc ribbon domain-containing protein [Actinomycetota bacterium]
MKADTSRQWRLLDLQKLDTRLDQIAHRVKNHPVAAQAAKAEQEAQTAREEVVIARTALMDIDREITRAEVDVQQVRDRATRNQARLDAGTGSPKDLQALQHELEALSRRQGELEDIELEIMERAEDLRAVEGRREQQAAQHDATLAELVAQRDAELTELNSERERILAERSNISAGVGQDLLDLYLRIREQRGGIAAAALGQRRCGGCGLELDQSELARIRGAVEDEVLRHDECGRILVRTAESGL